MPYDLKSAVTKMHGKRFNFALYKGAKENQVLITPKVAQPKLVTEMEKEIGEAKKQAKGVCFFENNTFIFATKNDPAPSWEQMTTKILKDHHCSQFLPVLFRKLGPNESDEVSVAEEGEGTETPGAQPAPTQAPPTAATPAPTGATPAPPTAPPPPPGSELDRLRQAAGAIAPRIKAALAAHPDKKGEISQALMIFNADLTAGDAASAKEALSTLLQMLKTLEAGGTGTTAPTAPTAPKTAAPKGNFVIYTQARLEWEQARKTVQAELHKLEQDILATCKYEDDFDEISAGTDVLYGMMEDLDDRLSDKLDDALNAETPEKRQALHNEAVGIIKEYTDFVNGDELIQEIDQSGFVNVAVRSTLTTTLADLGKKLSAPVGQN